ncbi:YHYH protein [Sphingobacteriales bacterium UPWRP_1]|nr:hypothetical protein BVG80_17275 [Sphingobacteriales bacterium TSM_CSM]PSJ74187.1 YHYH protein [Sphingobacteriales bacterium UPWRP_1]
MKPIQFLLLLGVATQTLIAHHVHTSESQLSLHKWHIELHDQTVEAAFSMFKDGNVFLEKENGNIVSYPVTALSEEDQTYVLQKKQQIEALNSRVPDKLYNSSNSPVYRFNFWVFVLGILLIPTGIYCYVILLRNKRKWLQLVVTIVVIACGLYGFKSIQTTDPAFINAAFIPFMPNIHTSWDDTYFYVHSLGIPGHQMMTGITNWQQQVPIPQCYVDNNAWSIPLNPVVAPMPTPTATNFFKGAIAIAANGVPIFNALNNTGTDSYLAGELDQYGGHCGRADDYHYHIAPLSLDSITEDILPIAFAFDGFAVYGSLEPDGTPLETLDANHGHYGENGVYHYHGNMTYPYMVGNMVGVVTADASGQIVPQAASQPIRPAQTPLPDAAITDCQPNGTNGYILTYTKSGQTYTINYSWTSAGQYTYVFSSPVTGTTTQVYNSFVPCQVPVNCIFEPVLSGIAVTCTNGIYTYTVPAGTAGTTYYWTATGGTIISGQGTNSIQVQWNSGAIIGQVNVVQSNP